MGNNCKCSKNVMANAVVAAGHDACVQVMRVLAGNGNVDELELILSAGGNKTRSPLLANHAAANGRVDVLLMLKRSGYYIPGNILEYAKAGGCIYKVMEALDCD